MIIPRLSENSKNCKYHLIYGEILSRLGVKNPLNILEIGLGSHNSSIVSHMEPNFTPGASLRAFRDVAKSSQIYGADIDREILFSDKRIQTAYVDCMSSNQMGQFSPVF